jgi:hypothetical protein
VKNLQFKNAVTKKTVEKSSLSIPRKAPEKFQKPFK